MSNENVLSNDNCPIKELVDKRCAGLSFDELAEEYGVSKMQLYVYYEHAKERNYDGYEPFDISLIEKLIREGRFTVPEIAQQFGLTYKGLRIYMADRKIGRVPTKAKVKRLRDSKKSMAWIAKFYGLSYGSFKKWLKENCPELLCRESAS